MRADGVFSGGGIKGLAFAGALQAASQAGYDEWVQLPDDVGLYVDEHDQPLKPEEFPIADAVRISAGFPYFFPPRSLRDAHTRKQGVLVDGGVASPYPVFLFDHPQPQRPTWGFRLFAGSAPEKPSYTSISGLLWPIDMLKAIVDTSTNALDKFEEKEYHPRTISLPTGDIATLDFALTKQQKEFLYESGFQAAKAFFDANPTGVNTYGAIPANIAHPGAT